ncbi:hypothetical protein FM21_35960 [Streptomyces mutabilis]|uniref:Uncharacterized protein n=1 Tax=Streptomyces mutabilis TaxID=67332 RepID=A0A086MQJ3_9ACTN|nr:hypothetical protein FM21_35960 [Streptomyces mutabilis]
MHLTIAAAVGSREGMGGPLAAMAASVHIGATRRCVDCVEGTPTECGAGVGIEAFWHDQVRQR